MRLPPLLIKKNCFWSLFLLAFAQQIIAQSHPAWRHLTVDDGLPNNAVYGSFEDKKGKMWFATGRGITMHDGYKFHRFPTEKAATEANDNAVFHPQADSLGRVWFSNASEQLFYVENDTIRAWRWNHLLRQFRFNHLLSVEFSFFENNSILFNFLNFGIVRIFENGRIEKWSNTDQHGQWMMMSGIGNYWRSSLGASTLNPSVLKTAQAHSNWTPETIPQVFHVPFESPDTIEALSIPNKKEGCARAGIRLGPNHYLLFALRFVFEIKNGKQLRVAFLREDQLPDYPATVHLLADGRIAIPFYAKNRGVHIFKNVDALFARQPETVLLEGQETSFFRIDQSGGQWVTTLRNGIFYFPNPALKVWDEQAGLSSKNVLHLAEGRDGTLFCATSDNLLWKLDTKTGQLEGIEETKAAHIKCLFFDKKQDRLIVGGMPSRFLEGQKWFPFPRFSKKPPGNGFFDGLFTSRDGVHYFTFSSIMLDKKERKSTAPVASKLRIQALGMTETPDGRIWAAMSDGLFEWKKNDSIQIVENLPEPLRRPIQKMNWLPDGTFVAAVDGQLCFWKENCFFNAVRVSEENLHCMAFEGDSVVWAGGRMGLFRVSGWKKGENLRIVRLALDHGLPSRQINDICFTDGFLWAATAGGLVKITELPKKQPPKKPFLEAVLVNGQKWEGTNATFLHDQNQIEIRFLSINHRQNGDILYRFRLSEKDDWQETRATQVLFSRLQPDAYFFETQAQNEDGIWSATTAFRFKIKPPFWKTFWFIGLCIGAAFVPVVAFYRYRLNVLKSQIELREQAAELEKKALRAQMDPHFVFNSLNSVQDFILSNDREAAASFLAQFAMLIRQTLDHSFEKEISLDQEIEYLRNFLTLESQRFRGTFRFEIAVSPQLDLFEIGVPPMLVQPFVENAVVHGMRGKKGDGLVRVAFEPFGEKGFRATIDDNGPGLFQNEKNGHRSVGTELSRQRLAAVSKHPEAKILLLNRQNENGQIIGTRAVLTLP